MKKFRLDEVSMLLMADLMGQVRAESKGDLFRQVETNVRRQLGLSLPIETDGGIENLTLRVAMYDGLDERRLSCGNGELRRKLRNALRTYVKRNNLKVDETLARALGRARREGDSETLSVENVLKTFPDTEGLRRIWFALDCCHMGYVPSDLLRPIGYAMDWVAKIFRTLWRALTGRFGRKVLKTGARIVYCLVVWGIITWMIVKFIAVPVASRWTGIVALLRYVIKG